MEWATPDNVSYLLDGDFNPKLYDKWQKVLDDMIKTANKDKALRKIRNTGGDVAYTIHHSRRNGLPYTNYWHDRRLRNCVAKYLNINNQDWTDFLNIDPPADAMLKLFSGNVFFEFDSGYETTELEEKLTKYYSGPGQFRVIFFMAHSDNIKRLEKNRLDYLFKVVGKLLRHKPNRVLANTYTDFLKTGKLYNLRREQCN